MMFIYEEQLVPTKLRD